MNLLNALLNVGKGAANATGQFTGNRQAMMNAEKAYQRPLPNQLAQWGTNAAGALSLPFALEGAARLFPEKPSPINYNFKMNNNLASKLADFGDYKMGLGDWEGNSMFKGRSPQINELIRATRHVSKQSGIPFYNMAPSEAQTAISKFLEEYQKIHGSFDW